MITMTIEGNVGIIYVEFNIRVEISPIRVAIISIIVNIYE